MITRFACVLLMLSLTPGFAETTTAPEKTVEPMNTIELQKLFDTGYNAFKKEKYSSAISTLWKFVDNSSDSTLNTEWGLFFLGLSYDRHGLSHAAIDTYSRVLNQRPNPQIVNAVLRRVETISQTQPFDHELIINHSVLTQNFGFVEPDLKAFVNYHQGVFNWANGLFTWGNKQFQAIPEGTFYYHKYQIQLAKYQLYTGHTNEAKTILESIVRASGADSKLQNEARVFLARLYYEEKKYAEAADRYQFVADNRNEQDSLLLEQAWAEYLNKDINHSLGLLYAFSAPSFTTSFTPEYYVLKTHLYKDRCHYESAVTTREIFFNRYQQALNGIYERLSIDSDNYQQIHRVLLNRPSIQKHWDFLNLLIEEKSNINVLWSRKVKDHLRTLYDLKIQQTQWTLKEAIKATFENMANTLLVHAEEMDLIGYEMGVERFQDSPSSEQISSSSKRIKKTIPKGMVQYSFKGEYWTDELDHYIADLSDECLTIEDWSSK